MVIGHNENNQATIRGEITSPFKFSHEESGIKFYITNVSVRRRSNMVDVLPVMVSDKLIDTSLDYTGEIITVNGQYRSRNSNYKRLILFIFAKKIEFTEEELDASKLNEVVLSGYICKAPIYRRTPLGKEIADVILAVNRSYGKTDYIPCVFWGKDAEDISGEDVGKHVWIAGRIQSRTYIKKLTETDSEERIAYEVSVRKKEIL